MPLLPRNNNLDFNDDATIQASKQIRTMSLANMKNPLTDPDSNTLSALSNEKSLNESFDNFSKMLITLQNYFIKAKSEGARIVEIMSNRQALAGAGKEKVSKLLSSRLIADEERSQPSKISSAEEIGRFEKMSVENYSNRLTSQGVNADAFIEDPDEELEFKIPKINYEYDGDGDDGYDDFSYDMNSSHSSGVAQVFTNRDPNSILSSLILEITKQIRYMDLLLVSKIKPNVQKLNSGQLTTLSQTYKILNDLWKNFSVINFDDMDFSLVDYIKDVVSFGSQIIRILEEELNKLKIDLLIVVNSYKQNEAIQNPNFMPDTFWENSSVREMEGSGRTFTGRNTSCRDIPTIWKGAVRECAYKYML